MPIKVPQISAGTQKTHVRLHRTTTKKISQYLGPGKAPPSTKPITKLHFILFYGLGPSDF